jgi:hypothetical protein
MSTFLQLVRKAARDGGTVRLGLPASVVGQSGEEAAIVYYVQEAWREIQTSRADWLWMRGEFTATLGTNVTRYTAASFNLTRWGEWITADHTVSTYPVADGVAEEADLPFLDWNHYRRIFERGPQEAQRPCWYSVSPAGEFCVGPPPDAAYTVRGDYRKSPQDLVNDTDVPEMPARFHDLIAHRALMLHSEGQEAEFAALIASRRYRELLSDLLRDQLPRSGIGMLASALA